MLNHKLIYEETQLFLFVSNLSHHFQCAWGDQSQYSS